MHIHHNIRTCIRYNPNAWLPKVCYMASVPGGIENVLAVFRGENLSLWIRFWKMILITPFVS